MESAAQRSVLFVDDEDAIRTLAKDALTNAGYVFDEAADGAEAVAKLERRPYDVAVVDIIMPGREGVETIVEIKSRWPGVYVVAISGGGRVGPDDFLRLAKMLGADTTLKKPFRFTELIAAIGQDRPGGLG